MKFYKKILPWALLFIIVIFTTFFTIKQINLVGKVPTGNIDIFNINCDCNSDDTVFKESDFSVNDKEIVWQENSFLRIFSNPAYEFKSIIAPGSSNAYQFVINNNNKFNIKYNFTFTEENKEHINMKYRLKRNGEYITEGYVYYDDLNFSNLDLGKLEHDDYLLEWKWIDAKNDTEVSFNDASYALKITIQAESAL